MKKLRIYPTACDPCRTRPIQIDVQPNGEVDPVWYSSFYAVVLEIKNPGGKDTGFTTVHISPNGAISTISPQRGRLNYHVVNGLIMAEASDHGLVSF